MPSKVRSEKEKARRRAVTKKKNKKAWRAQEPVTLEERLAWATTRVRAARYRCSLDPNDPVLRVALDARRAEQLKLRDLITRLETNDVRTVQA